MSDAKKILDIENDPWDNLQAQIDAMRWQIWGLSEMIRALCLKDGVELEGWPEKPNCPLTH